MTFCKHPSEISSASFVKLPRSILDSSMSIFAKYLYALLLSRAQLSAKNGYIDGLGIYVFCTVEEAARLLSCSRDKAISTLQELELHHLIHREKQSPGRTRRIRFYPIDSPEALSPVEDGGTAVENPRPPVEDSADTRRESPLQPVGNIDTNNILSNYTDYSETVIKKPEQNHTDSIQALDTSLPFSVRRMNVLKEMNYFQRIIDPKEDPLLVKQEAADRLGCTVDTLFDQC